jgi:ketosteroid isomerase-like protein
MNSSRLTVVAAWMAGLVLTGIASGAETAPPVSTVPAEAIPADPAKLRDLVAELDRRMFDAYNAHDVAGLMAWFADDLEFYHDTGGVLDHAQVAAGFTNVFASNRDIRRDLVEGSLEVYPIKGYGAIEIGTHRFCHTENGKADCGTFRFMQIWRLEDGAWQVSREVSYGH